MFPPYHVHAHDFMGHPHATPYPKSFIQAFYCRNSLIFGLYNVGFSMPIARNMLTSFNEPRHDLFYEPSIFQMIKNLHELYDLLITLTRSNNKINSYTICYVCRELMRKEQSKVLDYSSLIHGCLTD